jgi:alkyl hydroperoxide reductase subunit D
MPDLDSLKDALVDDLKDLRLNLGAVLSGGALDEAQRYAVALTSAYFLRANDLAAAIRESGGANLSAEAVSDAKAAAAIMAMNTVYYRFRHMVGKEGYAQRPAGLRLGRMARPATSKALFELCSIACAALAGCEACIQAHEKSLRDEGATEEQVHDAVRIAAVVQAFLVATTSGACPRSVAGDIAGPRDRFRPARGPSPSAAQARRPGPPAVPGLVGGHGPVRPVH